MMRHSKFKFVWLILLAALSFTPLHAQQLFSATAPTIVPGPVEGPSSAPNYLDNVRILNNTNPSFTLSNPDNPVITHPTVGTYGMFLQYLYVTAGPCIPAGGIKSVPTIASGGTGYVTGDQVSLNGGTAPLILTVNGVNAGAVTSFGQAPQRSIMTVPYGTGYSAGSAIATTALTGSGTGLTLNVASSQLFTGSAGPNCAWVGDWSGTSTWATEATTWYNSCTDAACTNGQSVTFEPFYPAPPELGFTTTVDYQGYYPSISFTIATHGSGQTPGNYFVYPTGGGGSGMRYGITVQSDGTVTQTNTTNPFGLAYGSGYTSCPTMSMPAAALPNGSTAATFTCKLQGSAVWTLDTSLPAGSYYFNQGGTSLTIGLTQDKAGNLWGVFPVMYPLVSSGYTNHWNGQFATTSTGYVAIHESLDGGKTWQAEHELVFDDINNPHCTGNTMPCEPVVAGMTTTPSGKLGVVYWTYNPYVGGLNPAAGSTCCFWMSCDPAAADCNVYTNWTTTQIPLTAAGGVAPSPDGHPYVYDLQATTFPNGAIYVGLISGTYFWVYFTVSCDDGATWSTGNGCPAGLPTFFNVSDTYGTVSAGAHIGQLVTQEYYMGCYTNCQSATNATYILIDRNNYAVWNGWGFSYEGTQTSGGPPIFGYSTDTGKTWHLAQPPNLNPYSGVPYSGLYSVAGTYIIDTGIKAPSGNDWWTFNWVERDSTTSNGYRMYDMTSTVDPGNLIANLASWTNASLQPLWFFSLGPNPSTPRMVVTAPGKIAYDWHQFPGNSSAGWGYWWSWGTYRINPQYSGFSNSLLK